MEKNETGGFYEPERIETKREYTARQRWLILASLAIGIVFSWVLFSGKEGLFGLTMGKAGLRYAAFWLTYLISFYIITWERTRTKATGWALAALAVWLMARYAVYEETNLNAINFLAIPLVLMLHAVECTSPVSAQRQGGYISAYACGWAIAPFVCIGRFFGAVGSLGAKKDTSPGARAVKLGLIVGVCLALVIVPLLLSADTAISGLLSGVFKELDIGDAVVHIILALVAAVLFYSFIFRMAYEQKPNSDKPYNKPIAPSGVGAAVGVLLGIYAIFAAFQFTYLTGLAGLPEGLTYSQYATRGFSELCAVAAINLVVFGVCVTFTPDTKLLRGMLTALLAATVMLLASAMARLVMYIDAYGLTINRILPFWFMVCMGAVIALCALKLYKPNIRLLRMAAAAFLICYLALSALNLDAVIARSVVERADARGELTQEDVSFLRTQVSADAQDVLKNSAYWEELFHGKS